VNPSVKCAWNLSRIREGACEPVNPAINTGDSVLLKRVGTGGPVNLLDLLGYLDFNWDV
jgi:hypothetical protein